jgi:serine/threonine protein kinase
MKFADGKALIASLGGWPKGDELGQGGFGVVPLAHEPMRKVRRAVKPLPKSSNARNLAQDVAIREHLNHPLIIGFKGPIPASGTGERATATQFTPNGCLADHLPSNHSASLSLLRGDTRIAIIIAGIVLGMQYLHSRRFIHRDLKPESILLDWDWIVHIGDFSHGVSLDALQQPPSEESEKSNLSHWLNAWYAAPEAHSNVYTSKSDVFSFALILYEILAKKSGFSKDLTAPQVMKKVVIDKTRPEIPDFVLPNVRRLIIDCWADDPDDRPSFASILDRLKQMKFKIAPKVDSSRVEAFVSEIEHYETLLGTEVEASSQ